MRAHRKISVLNSTAYMTLAMTDAASAGEKRNTAVPIVGMATDSMRCSRMVSIMAAIACA